MSDGNQDELASELNRICFAAGLPFLPVQRDLLKLHVGPFIRPGKSGCWQCWLRRVEQHSSDPIALRELRKYQTLVGTSRSAPFLPAHVGLAGALLLSWIRKTQDTSVGRYIEFDLESGEQHEGHLVGIHRCAICGDKGDPLQRTVKNLYEELQQSGAILESPLERNT
ncbi:TOMM precursor leader peptide-binding protein [Terriglobus sp. 2YAB30_2]